jgi:uncharacterized membrane protein YfcA
LTLGLALPVSLATLGLLAAGSFIAGFVDAIAGGGGLITVPALLAAGLPPHTALATNKGQAAFGAISSATSFWAKNGVDRRRAPIGFLFGIAGALVGAGTVLLVPPGPLKPIVIVLLVAAAIVVLWPKKRRDIEPHAVSIWATAPIALGMGFYDGFFGPGTGSLLIVAFVLVYGDALTRASGNAKIVNLASNLGALALFTIRGAVLYRVALPMAAANALGAFAGAHVAMKRGDNFVRWVVVAVVSALLAKVIWDLAH